MVKFYRTDDKLIHELDTLQGGTWIQMVNPSVAEGQMVADELFTSYRPTVPIS